MISKDAYQEKMEAQAQANIGLASSDCNATKFTCPVGMAGRLHHLRREERAANQEANRIEELLLLLEGEPKLKRILELVGYEF